MHFGGISNPRNYGHFARGTHSGHSGTGDRPTGDGSLLWRRGVVAATEGFSIVLCDLKTRLENGRTAKLVQDKALLSAAVK